MKDIITFIEGKLNYIYGHLHLRFSVYIIGIPRIVAMSKNFYLNLCLGKEININKLISFMFNNLENSTYYHVVGSYENEPLFAIIIYIDILRDEYDCAELVNELYFDMIMEIREINSEFEYKLETVIVSFKPV